MDKIEWTSLEYEDKERSTDWYWALGVIVVTGVLSSIIFNNYFFAALLILSGILLGIFAKKKPDMIQYELNQKGLKIRSRIYPYERIESFWIQQSHHDGEESDTGKNLKPLLFIKSERLFIPIITIPIDESLAEDIHSVMISKDIPEERMEEHMSEKIMERLGF